MLSKSKHVKTNFHCSLGILRIVEESSSWETFDPISAIKKWNIDTVRRTAERGSRRYKSRNFAKVNGKSLSDDDSYNEEEDISENGKFESLYCMSKREHLCNKKKCFLFHF